MAKKYSRLYRSLSILILLCLSLTSNSKELIDKVAVIVNDSIIVESEITRLFNEFKQKKLPEIKKLNDKEIRDKVIDSLILRSIKIQLAKELGIKSTQIQVDNTLSKLAQQNNLTLSQLKQVITEQQGSYLQFRKQIANNLVISQLEQNTIHSRIQINEQDLKEEILLIDKTRNTDSKYHLSHYQILSKSITGESLNQIATTIRQQLIDGHSIIDIQKTVDPSIEIQNKDLGLLSIQSLPNIFINGITGLSKGDYSNIMSTANGVHILHVLDRENASRIIIPELKARHILLTINTLRNEEQTVKQINNIRTKLDSTNFSDLAKQFSEDPGSAINGGDLGWFGPGKMVQVFEAQLSKLQINDISKPFKSQFGWHIVQLQGKRKTDITDIKIKELAQKNLIDKKVEIDTERWEKRIRQEAYVKYQ